MIHKFVDDTTLSESWLVRQYKLLYKPMAKVMGKGDFRPPTAAKPLHRF